MIKKIFDKTTLRMIATGVLLALAAALYTVGAWMTSSPAAVVIGGRVEIRAAHIGLTATAPVTDFGIPGEPDKEDDKSVEKATLFIEINVEDDSDRAFVYEVRIPASGAEIMSGAWELGTLELDIEPGGRYFGVWCPKENEDKRTIQIPILLYYYGEEVIDEDIVEAVYDGNETQRAKFSINGISILYAQATPQAVVDVFGVTMAEAIAIIERGSN